MRGLSTASRAMAVTNNALFQKSEHHFFKNQVKVQALVRVPRHLSSKGNGENFTINMPAPATHSWERSAKLVKKIDTSNQYLEHIRETHDPALQIKTLEDELRGTMGKALGKQGEKVLNILNRMLVEKEKFDELRGILVSSSSESAPNGRELETTTDNVPVDSMRALVDSDNSSGDDGNKVIQMNMSKSNMREMYTCVQNHNRMKEEATHARWELLVHRQAIGFITQNHKYVHEKFKIPEKLVLPGNANDWAEFGDVSDMTSTSASISKSNVTKEGVSRNWGDQLDWWERIGRWR